MPHSIVIHAVHNDDIPHDSAHGVRKLTDEFVEKLKHHGHDVDHHHVHHHIDD